MEPWYKLVTPRKEVREGRSFNPDEFAIALEQVVAGIAPDQDVVVEIDYVQQRTAHRHDYASAGRRTQRATRARRAAAAGLDHRRARRRLA